MGERKETLRMILLNTAMNKGSLTGLLELFVEISARLARLEELIRKKNLGENDGPDSG